MSSPTSSKRRPFSRSPLRMHIGVLTVLLLISIAMIVKLAMDWAQEAGSTAKAATVDEARLQNLTAATAPFHGLDRRVVDARKQIDDFLADRIPASYSAVASRMDEIEAKSGVRLSHVEFSQGAKGDELTEVSIDCGVEGEYRQIMQFVNGLERDQTFFVVRAMTLNGQQGGLVDLRLQVSTWLRPAEASILPIANTAASLSGAPDKSGKE